MVTDIKYRLRGLALAALTVVSVALLAFAFFRSTVTALAQTPDTALITINAQAGLTLDPFVVTLQAGGPVSASTIAKDCRGFVTKNPTVTIDYGGKTEMVKAFFYSDGDPVLLLQLPDGKFVCNDNTNPILLDPTLTLVKPVPGKYHVWVGSAAARDLIPGFLVLTGHADVNAGGLALQTFVKRPAQPEVLPANNRVTFAATRVAEAKAAAKSPEKLAAEGKPLTAQVTAAGDLPVPEVATEGPLCGGLITVAPSYAIELSGKAKALGVMFEGDGDATILVRSPDGKFICADDADKGNLNPLVIVGNPSAGTYLIWVGRVDPTKPVTGKLTVAPTADLVPAVLKRKQ